MSGEPVAWFTNGGGVYNKKVNPKYKNIFTGEEIRTPVVVEPRDGASWGARFVYDKESLEKYIKDLEVEGPLVDPLTSKPFPKDYVLVPVEHSDDAPMKFTWISDETKPRYIRDSPFQPDKMKVSRYRPLAVKKYHEREAHEGKLSERSESEFRLNLLEGVRIRKRSRDETIIDEEHRESKADIRHEEVNESAQVILRNIFRYLQNKEENEKDEEVHKREAEFEPIVWDMTSAEIKRCEGKTYMKDDIIITRVFAFIAKIMKMMDDYLEFDEKHPTTGKPRRPISGNGEPPTCFILSRISLKFNELNKDRLEKVESSLMRYVVAKQQTCVVAKKRATRGT